MGVNGIEDKAEEVGIIKIGRKEEVRIKEKTRRKKNQRRARQAEKRIVGKEKIAVKKVKVGTGQT